MKIKYIICFFVAISCLSGCCREEEEPWGRTVLFYLVASNLGNVMEQNMNDMMVALTQTHLNNGHLVVFYSRDKDYAEMYEIQIDKTTGRAVKQPLRTYEGKSAISSNVMQEVINDAITLFPAKSYGMVLSSHGTGWLPTDFNMMFRSFGEENKKKMEIYELAAGLPNHLFEFLIFDVCSMASVECVYELKNKAEYIVASPSETMSYGIPYKDVIQYLFTKKVDYENFINGFYTFYTEYNAPYGNISVTETSELENLAHIVREIVGGREDKALFEAPDPNWQVLTSLPNCPTKLYDFEDVIMALASNDQYTHIVATMSGVITGKRFTPTLYCTQDGILNVRQFSGLSIYPMQTSLSTLNTWYKQLAWYKAVYE